MIDSSLFQSNIGIHDSVWDIVRAARAPLFNAVFALVAQINGEDSREVLSIRAGSTQCKIDAAILRRNKSAVRKRISKPS